MSPTLTKMSIESLVAKAKTAKTQLELIDGREPGLRIRAGERSATWVLVARLHNGKRSRIKLGVWPVMGISAAREAARTARGKIVDGVDVNEQRRDEAREAALEIKTRVTLKDVLDLYETSVLSQHRRGAATRRALDGKKGLLKTFSQCKPNSISRAELAEQVRKHARTAPISANRKLAYASAFFNWCVEEEIIELNPAEKIRKPAKENERDRFHSLDELREIWAAAGTLGYPFEQLYRLLIVLPMRREEVAGMPVADLALGSDAELLAAAWVLPAGRTKNAKALRVPLSSLARSIIKEALAHDERLKDAKLVFTTTGETPVSGFTKAKRRLDKAIATARSDAWQGPGESPEMEHWTVHDLRTSFNTHACEILGVPPHVADRILNHVATATRSKIMRVYNKSELFEERRNALNAWANLIENHVIGRNVAQFEPRSAGVRS